MDVTLLRHFAAVAEELHFSRAAKTLGISRPTLSSSIKQIEAELGIEIFDRSADSTILTDAGHALLEDALPRLAAEDARAALLGTATTTPRPLRIAFVPGVTVGKWTQAWEQRRPDVALEFLPGSADDATAVLHNESADLSFVRLPVARDGLSVIRLYSETAVVVAAKDHPIALFDTVSVADLAGSGETVVENPGSVADAVELVAAGVGLLILPQSIARLHARKDVVARAVVDAPVTDIAITWVTDALTDDMEEFVGIVRGRTAASSRTGKESALPAAATGAAAAKAKAKGSKPGGGSVKASRSGGSGRAVPQRNKRRGSR